MAARDLTQGIASTDVAEGAIVAGTVDGRDVVLVRHHGRVCALAGQCTHAKAPLAEGIVADGTLRCPWHHARFDLSTGEAVHAPAFAPLSTYRVSEVDGRVTVSDTTDAAPAPETLAFDRRVVIVGGGAAGHACAEMFARHGAGAAVTLIGEESEAPYDRTMCSKQYLSGDKARDAASLPDLPGVAVRLGQPVERIDRAARQVTIGGGERLSYDMLVLATGAGPIVPGFTGGDRDEVFVVRSLADADRLIAASEQAGRAIVLGSSYIGLEVAASLIARGLAVTVISDDPAPLIQTAGPEVGAMVQRLHEDQGVTFLLGRSVERWDGEVATLDDGSRVAGDLLVAGTGVAPRIDLAEAAGLTTRSTDEGGGIVVDARLATSDPSIRAIGDIASVPDPRLGHPVRVEHWVVAQRMGQWLARHLLGLVEGDYVAVPFFWSGHYDTNLRYVGHADSPDERRIDGDVAQQDAAVFFTGNGDEQAVLTIARDRQALKEEVRLEARS
ncbi:FAD-dependent oxidoreductase [Sphingomonas sp.]|jgi:NADPH-dependent 2,4-dienoyl-CoA reductase/sulfur reductase-like enzyme/nitrite reductase/ring-hydroxylating ferredoxin subunit|uniref:FAD-dependent oxidoreductase n=1 Tax=Sphingomonas sp. TaxID=28214 RepID=UPI0035C8666A